MSGALAKYEAASRALAEAVSVDDVLEVADKAEALRAYYRQAGDKTMEANASKIRFRAERRAGELLAEMKAAGLIDRGGNRRSQPVTNSEQVEIAAPAKISLKELGIDRKESMRFQKIAEMPADKFDGLCDMHAERVLSGKGLVSMDLTRINSEVEGRESRRAIATALANASASLPSGKKYPVIYADPPWHRDQGVTSRSYENHYPTMPWQEICDLPVKTIVQPDAWLFLWIPRSHAFALFDVSREIVLPTGEVVSVKIPTPLAWAVASSWGFDEYSTCFVWTKTDDEHPDEAGGAMLVRDQDELLLLFKRGRGLPKPEIKFGSNHRERSRPLGHSVKPQHFRTVIATMAGKGVPVLEMFARFDASRPAPEGFELWGNQAQGESARAEAASEHQEPVCLPGDGAAFAGLCDYPPWATVPANEICPGCRCHRSVAVAPIDCACCSRDVVPLSAKLDLDGGFAVPRGVAPALAEIVASIETVVGNAVEMPATLTPLEASKISEFDALKSISDFCYPRRREILDMVAEHYYRLGFCIIGNGGDWILRDAGKARLRELEDERRALLPPKDDDLEIPEFLRREPKPKPQSELDLVVPVKTDSIDDRIQTRMPLDADELAELEALQSIERGDDIDSQIARSLIGKSWVHCPTSGKLRLRDEGRAALAAFVAVPGSAAQAGVCQNVSG